MPLSTLVSPSRTPPAGGFSACCGRCWPVAARRRLRRSRRHHRGSLGRAPEPEAPEYIPVVRYARYTLVELAPMAAQRDLLLQTIDVSMPEDARATVGDGLRHVLKRSGYGLCQTAHAVIELYALPLPAAHLHLGPMTLRDALLTLAGPAWELHADDRADRFASTGPATAWPSNPRPPSAADAVQTFPLMPSIPGGQP